LWKLVQNYNYTVEIMSHYRMALSQTVCSDINSTSTASDSTCYPACNRTSTTSDSTASDSTCSRLQPHQHHQRQVRHLLSFDSWLCSPKGKVS
jgi:hypothetical protein